MPHFFLIVDIGPNLYSVEHSYSGIFTQCNVSKTLGNKLLKFPVLEMLLTVSIRVNDH